ncbi:hypothetical protein QBC38DRAFT_479482 [Podospora fimiseda]|uniref:AA1-like domain-containing protein n=1 Tax=Podospora fimiseda TaxID=252190 RepID=A0AAN7GTT2_9PEZI|nr:hypothetical protein QBC38DRAFT_479482 [Podospora fimiseda]
MTYSLYYLFSLLALIISVTSYPFLGQVSDVKMDDLAQPQPQTCTEMSGKTVWTARAFHLRSEVKMLGTVINGGTGWLTFNLSNPAIGYELSCEGSSTKIPDFFTADQEFSCSGPSGDPDATANFRFDKPTGSFKISQVWFCNDNMRYVCFGRITGLMIT